MTAVLVILTIVFLVGLDVALMAYRRRRGKEPAKVAPRAMLDPRPPQGIFLDPNHAWVRITSEGTLRIGVDEFLTEAAGEIDSIGVVARGTKVERGDRLITLLIGGRELTVPAPAAGEVVTVNERVLASPYLVARDPYGVGWVVGLWTPDHQAAIRPLRIGASAAGLLRAELQRFVEFLHQREQLAAPVLADGGVPLRGALRALADEDWSRFQNEFLSERGEGE